MAKWLNQLQWLLGTLNFWKSGKEIAPINSVGWKDQWFSYSEPLKKNSYFISYAKTKFQMVLTV